MGFNYAKYKAAVMGSPLNKNGFGPKEQEKTTTGDSGNLKEVIEDVRTKTADVIGKLHKGFDKPLVRESDALDRTSDAFNASEKTNTLSNALRLGGGIARVYGSILPGAIGKFGGQILENVVRPGKQGDQLWDQIDTSIDDARKELKSEKNK